MQVVIRNLLIFSALILSSCNLIRSIFLQTVIREVNACFSDSLEEILIFESRYKTPDKTKPYYSDDKASDYEIIVYKTDLNLSNKIKIDEWKEKFIENNVETVVVKGGMIEYAPVYYLKSSNIIAGMNFERKGAFIRNLSHKTNILLQLKLSIISNLLPDNYDYLASSFEAISMAPSPDSKTIAVCYFVTFIPEGSSLYVSHQLYIISFYDLNGTHINSRYIPFSDKEATVVITPYLIDNYNERFLWGKDSKGIFIIQKNEAYFVYNNSTIDIVQTNYVPEKAIVTRGGWLSDDGKLLKIEKISNNTRLYITNTEKITSIYSNNITHLSNISYAY